MSKTNASSDTAAEKILKRISDGAKASAAASAFGPMSEGSAHASELPPLTPSFGSTPPNPPTDHSGGGNGGGGRDGHGGGKGFLSRFSADSGFSRVLSVLGILLLLYGWMTFSNHMSSKSRDDSQSSEIKELAMAKEKLKFALEQAEIQKKIDMLKTPTKQTADQGLVTAHVFNCQTQDDLNKGFQTAGVQTFSSSFMVPQQCALVEITGNVTRVEGYNYSLAYPDKDNPGQWFSCGPNGIVKECVSWINTVRSDSRYEDKRLRVVVGGSLKIFQ
jgi:hypothetical protein